jgi:hypothetical protein
VITKYLCLVELEWCKPDPEGDMRE